MPGMIAGIGVRLCAFICFAGFGWGMIRHFRRQGAPSRPLMLSAVLAIVSAAMNIGALFTGQPKFPVAGIVLYSLSAALFWSSVRVTKGKLAACWQGSVSETLVMQGPYIFIRHPFYLAYDLAWIAGYVATGWWPLAIAALAMALLYEAAARQEERALEAGPLANLYAAYKTTAGRYWPLCFSTRRDPSGRSGAGTAHDDGAA
jgi:protein-S-isoprenylcysteine O-methyltransferase Ste14